MLRNHFPVPIVNFLHKDKERLALRNNFRVTKKFLTPSLTVYDLIKQFNRFQKRKISKCGKQFTVKLGDKERFDMEQIGVKEPFPMTNCQFAS